MKTLELTDLDPGVWEDFRLICASQGRDAGEVLSTYITYEVFWHAINDARWINHRALEKNAEMGKNT
jgi:hypothetical protein